MEMLNIGAVAKMTGLSEFTIRAWERRYGVVKPKRTPSGRRVYDIRDVERLTLLRHLTEQGHAIRNIAALDFSRLSKLLRQGSSDGSALDETEDLISALQALDIAAFSEILKTTQLRVDTRTFLLRLIAPFFRNVGDLVQSGRLDIFHEHAASAVLRNILAGLLYSTDRATHFSGQPPILFATPEGDHHEFGILIGAVLAVLNGQKVFYLGPNMPLASLQKAVTATKSELVVLGIAAPEESISSEVLWKYVADFLSSCSPRAELCVAGVRSAEIQKRLSKKGPKPKFVAGYEEFERFIRGR